MQKIYKVLGKLNGIFKETELSGKGQNLGKFQCGCGLC